MPKKSIKGTCDLRKISVSSSNFCDLYEAKRRGRVAPRCRHCVHFFKEEVVPVDVEPYKDTAEEP